MKTKPLPCPCNGMEPVLALSRDKTRKVYACPRCEAKTVPMKTPEGACRVWNAGTSEAGKEMEST